MKLALKIFGGIVAGLILALLVLSVTGLEPHGGIPGLWIRGAADTAPVNDWAFTDQIREIKVQTGTWYGLPHSVTTWCIARDGHLYLATSGATTRSWPKDVARDPRVRLKIGDKVYDRVLQVVTDPQEKEAVLQIRAKKYAQKYPPPPGVSFTVYRAVGNDSQASGADTQQQVDNWNRMGDQMMDDGDYGSARSYYDRALKLAPSNTVARAGIANADRGMAEDSTKHGKN